MSKSKSQVLIFPVNSANSKYWPYREKHALALTQSTTTAKKACNHDNETNEDKKIRAWKETNRVDAANISFKQKLIT